ncbi:MAG: hypothetical protein IPK07_25465 [Deltaproteobacteria bacterium]|nr:hypothetical protein [Deltaproteobacteria bacterium]
MSLFPAAPFANGHTHIALVTDRVRTSSGSPMPSSDGFARIVAAASGGDADAARVRDAYRPVLASIRDAMGEDPTHAVIATAFTARSNEPVTRKMRALASAILARAKANPPRLEVDQVVPPLPALETKGVAAGVIGQMTTADYRGPDRRIVWDERGRPVEQREHALEFVLKLPKAGAGRAPVVIFGHGLGAFKETLFQVSSELGERGYATIGIDIGGHGSRMGEDGPIYDYFTFDELLATRDLFLQSIADEVQLARLVEGALATLDVVPEGGDGVPDLAPEVVGYVGQSMGTVLGGTYLAVEPSIDAAVLNVPGGGFVPLLQLSPSLSGIIEGFLPAGTTASERLVLFSLGQMLVDDIDPANFAAHVTVDPFPGHRPKDVLMQQAVDDEIVPGTATELLAHALQVPQVQPSLAPVFGLATASAPATGSALYQFRTGAPQGLNHALLLTRPGALDQAAEFIDSRVREGAARVARHEPG